MPRLDDPKEWAIVRSMYFAKDDFAKDEEDQIERLERMESRERFNNKSSR